MKPMTADLILTNGRVVTPDATALCRRALAIRGETFLAVGADCAGPSGLSASHAPPKPVGS